MKRFLVFFLVLFAFACSKENKEKFNLTEYIPENSEVVLFTRDFNQFTKDLKNNQFLHESGFKIKNKLSKELAFIQHLKINNEVAISFSNLSSDNFTYTLTTKKDSSFINFDSIPNKSVETLKSDDLSFQKIGIEDNVFFLYQNAGGVLLSNSKQNIIDLGTGEKILKNENFKKAYNAADPKKTSILLKNSAAKDISNFFQKFGFSRFQDLAEWSVLDLEISKNQIKTNGISLPGKDNNLLKIFKETTPKQIEAGKVCPDNFINLYSFSYSSFQKLQENLQTIRKDSISRKYPEVLDQTREITRINMKDGKALVLNAIEIEAAREKLAGLGNETDSFRNVAIFQMNEKFPNIFPELMKIGENKFYMILDHFIIFSESSEILQNIIISYQNSDTLENKNYFTELMSSLSSESSMLFISRPSEFANSGSDKLVFQKNSLAAFQFIAEDNFAHLHGVFNNSENKNIGSSEAEQVASFKIEAPLVNIPQFFKNHRTDQMDIAVQDENNLLYLISNKGNVFWKKQLDSQITGPIYEVDLFKNGNKQLAFSTGYHLEILDRNGNTVKPFPIKFNQMLTQPLAVFDYDNNRTYRFVLTQNKRLYMVGPKGKSIKGFDFENARTEIVKAPKHIRLGTKDYILVAEESGKLNILSRQGSIRVPVNENFNFSENEWYGHADKFVSSEPDSNLIEITQSGAVKHNNLGLAENNRVVGNDKNLVYLNENELSINSKIISLDFGLYTDPQLFEVDKRTLIALTDMQTQKVYVFNSDAELLEGFPVYGNSQVDIANADVDSKLELVVKGEENEILVYEF